MRSVEPCCQLRKTCIFSKTEVKPAFWPPDGQDDLQTGLLASKTASGRLFRRPRRPPDGSPGAQDGFWTGLLAPKTASRRVSWRPRRLSTGLFAPNTARNQAFRSKTAVTTAFCAAKPAICLALYDDCIDETSVGST